LKKNFQKKEKNSKIGPKKYGQKSAYNLLYTVNCKSSKFFGFLSAVFSGKNWASNYFYFGFITRTVMIFFWKKKFFPQNFFFTILVKKKYLLLLFRFL